MTPTEKEQMLSMLRHFWEEHEDLERWAGFSRGDLTLEFPEVLKAWDALRAAQDAMDVALKAAGPA